MQYFYLMYKIAPLIVLSIVLLFSSCKVKKDAIVSSPLVTNETSINKTLLNPDVCFDEQSLVRWSEYKGKVSFPKNDGPSDYLSFYTNPDMLNESLTAFPDNGTAIQIGIPVHVGVGTDCRIFELQPSNTMSPDLQKKYGGIHSFKGIEKGQPTNLIRIDYTMEEGLKAYLTIDGNTYILSPIKIGKEIIYISYDKKFTSDVKQPFED